MAKKTSVTKVDNSTMFGGKPFPNWQANEFNLPGYQNARIVFKNKTDGSVNTWGFLISPSSLSIQQANDIQVNKTMAGWFINRGGSALGNLSITGFFLDTLYAPERLKFFEMYNTYVKDQQNKFMEFVSNYSQSILIEGNYYHGLIQSINVQKSSQQQFLYQYSITFIFYKTTPAYTISSSSMSTNSMKEQMGLNRKIEEQIHPDGTMAYQALAPIIAGILLDK